MKDILPNNLIKLSKNSPLPIYVVGGAVRNYIGNLKENKTDIDICSPIKAEQFIDIAKNNGFTITSIYANTGTVNIKDICGNIYEYTCFRSDKYIRGKHTPSEIYFTENIEEDARRRDFTINAIYYDIKNNKFVDPLNGIADVKNKIIQTVAPAEKVFGEDGLRLMRLARQAGQLGFTPTKECIQGAKINAKLIDDIVPERIYSELIQILHADEKYNIKYGHYKAIKILDETRVLDHIIPELTKGRGMSQRADFHKYDILEHSLRVLRYSDKSIRLSALLHDIGKPECMINEGNVHQHHTVGSEISKNILKRLKAPNHVIDEVQSLILWHMYDYNGQTKENKIRKFIIEHYSIIEKLLLLKQADYSGCMDDLSPCPTGIRWEKIIKKMKEEKAPFTLKDLNISGNDILNIKEIPPFYISKILNKLLIHCALNPKDNKKEILLKNLKSIKKSLDNNNKK